MFKSFLFSNLPYIKLIKKHIIPIKRFNQNRKNKKNQKFPKQNRTKTILENHYVCVVFYKLSSLA